MDRSSPNYISEETFLLTELRYTLGQLRAQLGDLSADERNTLVDGRTIDRILQQMNDDELRFQVAYAEALLLPGPQDTRISDGLEEQFEARRQQTIELLHAAGDTWPPHLLKTVQRQVADDRQHTTAIADLHIQLRQ